MALETFPFDPADFLTDNEIIVEYLTLSFESENPRIIAKALGAVARARGGVEALSRQTGIETRTLAEAFGGEGNPDLGTVLKVTHALGVRLSPSLVA